ncbi:hypothetical protein KY347_06095 [Candidatus Woesearchaeota archaeon]|nr:hypothetical protein [Candidatus Woesearchaeota archaeon]
MDKLKIFFAVLVLMILCGCATSPKAMTFEEGVNRINEIDERFGSGMKTPPNSTEEIDELMVQLTGFSAVNENMPKSLEYLIDFRIKSLEAEKLHIEGWQWGKASTTDYGFGCIKGSARIIESARLRNSSAQKGYEAVSALQMLVNEFPEEAESVNLTQKGIVFLNAAYYQIEEKARKDASIIRNLCFKNESASATEEGG